jgi:hypothetical protein
LKESLPEWFLQEEILRTLYSEEFNYAATLRAIKKSIEFF